jgi:lipoprotein signal peptidase
LTKVMVYGSMMSGPADSWQSVRLLGRFLYLSPTHNSDGLFGWSYGPPFVYFVLPLLGMVLVTWFALQARDRWSSLAYGMILGGAVGNLVDRVRLGWVIDFIDIRIPQIRFHWFTFNLADAFVVIGIVLLLARELSAGKRERRAVAMPLHQEIDPASADSESTEADSPDA